MSVFAGTVAGLLAGTAPIAPVAGSPVRTAHATEATGVGHGCLPTHHIGSLCITVSFRGHFGRAPAGTWLGSSFTSSVAVSPGTGLVAGESCSVSGCQGLLGRTSSAGRSWSFSSTGDFVPAAIDFPTAEDGFAVGAGVAADHGAADAPGATGPNVCAYGGGNGEACDRLTRTVDGGRHWTAVRGLPRHIWALAFASSEQGWVAVTRCPSPGPPSYGALPAKGCAGEIMETTDAGWHWKPVRRTPGPVLALATGGGQLWAAQVRVDGPAGSRGSVVVLHRAVAGTSWSSTTVRSPTSALAGEVGPDIHASLVAVPSRAARAQPVPTQPVSQRSLAGRAAASRDAASPRLPGWTVGLTLFAGSTCAMHGCGLDTLFLGTGAGRDWNAAPLYRKGVPGCGESLTVVTGTPRGRLMAQTEPFWATCESEPERIWLSTGYAPPGGRWKVVAHYGYGPTFSALSMSTTRDGWATTSDAIVRTTDGGRHWAQAWPPPSPTGGFDFVSRSVGIGFGDISDPGAVLYTHDSGSHWAQVGSDGAQFISADFLGAHDGWLLGYRRGSGAAWVSLLSTGSGGRHWKDVHLPTSAARMLPPAGAGAQQMFVRARSARSAQIALPASQNSSGPTGRPVSARAWWTADAGRSWTSDALPGQWSTSSVTALSPSGALWAVAPGPSGATSVLGVSVHEPWTVGRRAGPPRAVWRTAGRLPPGTNWDIDAVSGTAACIWQPAFGDAVGAAKARARRAGILCTDDSGRSWSQMTVPGYDIVSPHAKGVMPAQLGPQALEFVPGQQQVGQQQVGQQQVGRSQVGRSQPAWPKVGWLLTSAGGYAGVPGPASVLWRTTDGGRSWRAAGPGGSPGPLQGQS